MNVSLPASISKVMTMRDKTVRLQIDVQEIHPDHMAEIFALNDKLGYFFFADQPIQEVPKDLPEIKVEKGEKTPGQRLRAVLHVLWSQTRPPITSEQFYREQIEKFIEHIKSKLN